MENEILVDLMVQLAALEAERQQCLATMARDARAADLLDGLQHEHTADAAAAADRLREARTHQRRIEADLAEVEVTLERKRSLLAVSSEPRETAALQREISGLEERLDELMTRACRLLDQAERRDRDAGMAEAEILARERRAVARMQEIEQEHARLAAALPEINQEISRLHSLVPSAVGRHLQRLWDREMQATVFMKDGACSACGALLTPQLALAVQHGRDLVRCPSCARYVVHEPWR